jgi:hypothetical protein
MCGKRDSDRQVLVELVPVFDGIDTGFRNRGLQIFNAIVRKAHQLRDTGSRTHGNLFVSHAGGNAELDRFALQVDHVSSLRPLSQECKCSHIIFLMCTAAKIVQFQP